MTVRSRWSLWLGLACLLANGAAIAVWQAPWSGMGPGTRPEEETSARKPTPGIPWFEDVTAAAGIDFRHFDPATDHHYIQETMGSGLAWIDYDNDGWPDLFCVQDGPVKPGTGAQPTSKLYRNNGDGTFTDVTEQVGLA